MPGVTSVRYHRPLIATRQETCLEQLVFYPSDKPKASSADCSSAGFISVGERGDEYGLVANYCMDLLSMHKNLFVFIPGHVVGPVASGVPFLSEKCRVFVFDYDSLATDHYLSHVVEEVDCSS